MYEQLSRIDLNLLVAFEILMEEQNTSRAADRLFISQSAMSKTLSRLRKMLGEELFTRSPNGLKPTAKAEALQEPIRELLSNAHGIVFATEFDPEKAREEIHLAIPDTIAIFILPDIVDILGQQAPTVILQSHNVIENYRDQLKEGMLDFCIYQNDLSPSLVSNRMGCHQAVCMMRKDHPLASLDVVDEATFLTTQHVLYRTPFPAIDETREFIEKSRYESDSKTCILETTQLIVGLELMLKTDALMIVPPGTKDSFICQQAFVEKPIIGLAIESVDFDICLLQHPRTLNSPIHQWVSRKITEVVNQIFPFKS